MTAHLHPNNDVIGTAGIPFPPHPAPRGPYRYVSDEGQEIHRSPLCPELVDEVYYALGIEEALYAYGECLCPTCRSYDIDLEDEDTGWTDPRFRRKTPEESDS